MLCCERNLTLSAATTDVQPAAGSGRPVPETEQRRQPKISCTGSSPLVGCDQILEARFHWELRLLR